MINRAAEFAVAGRINSLRLTEAVLDKIAVVNVQVKQRAARFSPIEEVFQSPARRFGDAAEAGGEDLAVSLLVDGPFHPGPLGPEANAHRGHEDAFGATCRLSGLARGW